MIAEFGKMCLIAAALIALWQGFASVGRAGPYTAARNGAWVIFTLVAIAFGMLVYAHVTSDFSVANVAHNSYRSEPLLYRITGSWGSHEGSMLLFALVLSGYGALLSLTREKRALVGRALGIMAWLMAGLLAFILLTSDPFARLVPVPMEGEELNPLLEDIGLSLHPPMLYLGYVGFGVVYALTLAALIERDDDWAGYARLIRPWVLLPWSLLGFGIALGSWWAYRELGWGGWWFWDPVENASLLPWLAATALLHSVATLRKTGQQGGWVRLLSIVTFLLSLTGTFLVRSGVLTSVHSFASDPARGLFILGYLTLVGGAGFALLARRSPVAAQEPLPLLSRGGLILFNNLLTLVMAASILLAMLYPLLLDALHLRPVSVGAPYYQAVVVPMIAPLLGLAGLGLLAVWVDSPWRMLWRRAWGPLLAAAVAAGIGAYAKIGAGECAGVFFGVWLMLASARSLWPWSAMSPARLGAAVAHGGLGLLAVAAVLSAGGQRTAELMITPGQHLAELGGDITVGTATQRIGRDYAATRVPVTYADATRQITLRPEERRYAARGTVTQEAAIASWPWGDIYAVIRTPSSRSEAEPLAGRFILRLYLNPWMQPLWLAMGMIGLGGLISTGPRGEKKR